MTQILGHDVRLTIDLDGEDHDITHLLQANPPRWWDGQHPYPKDIGWFIVLRELVNEIQIEQRARARADRVEHV